MLKQGYFSSQNGWCWADLSTANYLLNNFTIILIWNCPDQHSYTMLLTAVQYYIVNTAFKLKSLIHCTCTPTLKLVQTESLANKLFCTVWCNTLHTEYWRCTKLHILNSFVSLQSLNLFSFLLQNFNTSIWKETLMWNG